MRHLQLWLWLLVGCSGSASGGNALPDTAADVAATVDMGVVTEDPTAEPDAADDAAADISVQPDASPDAGGDFPDLESPQFPAGWIPIEPLVPTTPLCDIPPDYVANGGDPVNPDCGFTADSLSDRDRYDVGATLRVVAWNVEYGKNSAEVLTALTTHPELRDASILLLSEVARSSLQSEPDYIDQVRDIAEGMKMNYVAGVEWDRREHTDELGEHLVAILSKYPLGNVELIRHIPQKEWYQDEQLYGGRATLVADTLLGDTVLRLYSTHLDTRGFDAGRAEQGAEIRGHANQVDSPAWQLVGGDFNTYTCNPIVQDCSTSPDAETVIEDFYLDNWRDGTEGFNGETQMGAGFLPQRLDWILYRGFTVSPGEAFDAGGSDHYPIYTDIVVP